MNFQWNTVKKEADWWTYMQKHNNTYTQTHYSVEKTNEEAAPKTTTMKKKKHILLKHTELSRVKKKKTTTKHNNLWCSNDLIICTHHHKWWELNSACVGCTLIHWYECWIAWWTNEYGRFRFTLWKCWRRNKWL